MKAVKKTEFERVIVDTTVQEKAIAHPTDAPTPSPPRPL
jgi:IS5 family transposase